MTDGTSYAVTVAEDGPDHDCIVSNGSGRVQGSDVTDLMVICTNLIPHSVAISSAVPFTFDPRVNTYSLPTSLLQQEVSALVTGPTLTAARLAGQPIAVGVRSAPAAIAAGATNVSIDVVKGALSHRYELAYDRGARPMSEAVYARAADAGSGDGVGIAVAASDDYIAVGAWGEDSSTTAGTDNGTTDSGAVYVFRRDGDAWSYSERLKGSAITATRNFGHALAIDGDVLVVGAYGDDARGNEAGAAYVFRRIGGHWAQEQRLTASDGRAGDQFGFSVAVSGSLVAIGSPWRSTVPGNNDARGAVYTFRYDGGVWVEEPPVYPSQGGRYGWQVALHGQTLAMGAQIHEVTHVYRRVGTSWLHETLPDVVGVSLDLDNDVLAVGVPAVLPAGAVRIFSRLGGVWTETGTLVANPPTGGAGLGNAVAIHGDLVVSADSVTPAYLFRKVGGTWLPLPPLTLSGSPVWQPGVPGKVDIAGNSLVVGDYGDGGPGNTLPGSGTAWIFR